MVLTTAGKPGVRLAHARDRPDARIVGRLDAAGHHGQVHQGRAARARQRAALGRREGPFGEAVATLKRTQWTIF